MKDRPVFENLGYGRYPPERYFSKIHEDRQLFLKQLQARWESEFIDIARSYGVYLSDPDSATKENFEAFVTELVGALACYQDENAPPDWEIHLSSKYQRGNQ